MRMGRGIRWLILVGGLLSICHHVLAINLTITGSWYVSVDATHLQAGPGSDLDPTHASSVDQVRVDIQNTNRSWVVYVRMTPTLWHPYLSLSLRRTTEGSGPGWISGGTSWLELDEVNQQLFDGYKQRRDVRVQCEVSGVSVNVPPETYTTTVVYTIMEL